MDESVSSQMGIKANVKINIRNRLTNKIIKTIDASNRVTNFMLSGISNVLYGDIEIINKYIPAYIAVGDCTTSDTSGTNVSSLNVEVSDTKLYGEIPLNTLHINERVKISSKAINNNSNYITVTMIGYIQSNTFNDRIIKEIGLFTKESGNNCLARVILDEPIKKNNGEIIDIIWAITSTSVSSSN